jgi:hypothetical protein
MLQRYDAGALPLAGPNHPNTMDSKLKSTLLDQLAGKDVAPVLTELLAFLPDYHPDSRRVSQLEKRFREMEGRMEQGTLSKEDVDRVRSRIAGGLREVILDYKYMDPPTDKAPEEAKEIFKLDLSPETEEEDKTPKVIGFQGDIDYKGSPSKKEEIIVLLKGYGAAYHTAVQSIRKCGMDMQKGDREGGRIHATSQGNTVSRFGEVIHLWITPEQQGRTRIQVIVDSGNPEMVFDMGRHKQKLSALMHQLRIG